MKKISVEIKITFENAEPVDTHHVGKEWVYKAYGNNKSLKLGDPVVISLKQIGKLQLKAVVQEKDKYSDIGSATKEIDVRKLAKGKKEKIEINVPVSEDRGRYDGNTAGWKFVFSVVREPAL